MATSTCIKLIFTAISYKHVLIRSLTISPFSDPWLGRTVHHGRPRWRVQGSQEHSVTGRLSTTLVSGAAKLRWSVSLPSLSCSASWSSAANIAQPSDWGGGGLRLTLRAHRGVISVPLSSPHHWQGVERRRTLDHSHPGGLCSTERCQ